MASINKKDKNKKTKNPKFDLRPLFTLFLVRRGVK
jgi:hypothetical protein